MSALNLANTGDNDHDVDEVDNDANGEFGDLGGITPEEVMGRGQINQMLDDSIVALMESRVRKTGVLEKLQQWRDEDAIPFTIGGRPPLISDLAVLTGLLILAKEGKAMFITNLRDIFMSRVSDQARELLGLERSLVTFAGHISEKERWYANTSRAFQRLNVLMDPYPQERRSAKTYTQIQEILDQHDAELAEKRKARLDEFTRLFLGMTFKQQSRPIRRASRRMDVSFDQTYIQTPTKKGYPNKTLPKKIAYEATLSGTQTVSPGPVDAFAGWHVTTGERMDSSKGQSDLTAPSKEKRADYQWGWEINFAVRVDAESPGSKRFPGLAVAATLSLPNREVAEEAIELLRAASSHGLTPGVADADKQYFANSLQERLHDPAFELGYTPSTEYRIDRLGIQGGDHGAKYIEGATYCPATPKPLVDASQDQVDKKIDRATFRERVTARRAFQLHVKERPDAKGCVVLRCPALGPSPTVVCPLRELLKTRVDPNKGKVLPAVDSEDLPDFPDKICEQHSVSFGTAKNRRHAQAFEYGSKEFDDFHDHARNSIESLNNQIKSGGTEDIQSSTRRRVRGFGAVGIIVAILVTNFNL